MKTTAAIVLALVAVLALSACGGDDDSGDGGNAAAGGGYGGGSQTQAEAGAEEAPAPEPSIETIVVRDGAPVGGVAELEYDAGEQIRFKVRSNTADEVHVHGYDVTKEVPAGGTVTVSFPADLEGIYEAELHGSGEQIAELRVNP